MTVTSNIQGVIDRMKRKPRDVRTALARTLSVGEWDNLLRAEATRTLWALAKPNVGIASSEWGFVDAFLKTVLTGPFKTGFFAPMSNALPPILVVEEFAMARDLPRRALNEGSGPTLFSDFLNQFDQMVTDWVANEKNKDARDWEKSDEEIASWIGHLMLTPDSKLNPKRSGKVNPVTGKPVLSELEAKHSLMKHIVEYIQRRQTASLGSRCIRRG